MMRYFADSRDVRRGQPCNPEQYANLQEETMRRIVPGAGVTKSQFGENVMINSTATGGGRGNGNRLAKFASLNTDGNTMEVYLWNGADWELVTTTVYKPYILQYRYWNDLSLTYADGRVVTYDDTALNIRYQRRANWSEGGYDYEMVEEITPSYISTPGEELEISYNQIGELLDNNNAGRCWAVNGTLT